MWMVRSGMLNTFPVCLKVLLLHTDVVAMGCVNTAVSHFISICTAYHISLLIADPVCEALRRHPLHWYSSCTVVTVVLPLIDIPGQSKVSHFHLQIIVNPALEQQSKKEKKYIFPFFLCTYTLLLS